MNFKKILGFLLLTPSIAFSSGFLGSTGGSGGSGTVTSVDLSLPSFITVSGNPITTSGTLTGTLATQTAKTVFAGPTTGSAAAPTFRLLAAGDIPSLSYVTSVGFSVPASSIFTATGSPVTSSGTLGFTIAGNSGGIPYFDSSSTLNSSSALTNHAIVLGSGAGNAPAVLGSLGTTTTLLHGNAAGSPSFSAVSLSTDVTGNLSVNNLNSGTSASTTTFWRGDGTWATPAGSGTVTSVALTVPTSILSVTGSPVTSSGTLAIATTGTSGGIPYFSSSSALSSSAALTANQIVLGGGAGTTPASLGSLGTTTTLLHGNASGAPTFSAVSLTADVTGILPIANSTIATQAISASAIDWSTGSLFTKTLGANTTFTFSNQVSGQTIVVRLTNTTSNWTVTWPTVKWPAGSTPTMTVGAHSDVYTFVYDGTNIYGSAVQNF